MADDARGNRDVSVAIVEDLHDVREGLAALIGGEPGFRCVGAYPSAEDALRAFVGNLNADVLLLDIGLPGKSGIEALPEILALSPGLPVLMLSVYRDDDRIFDALCAGARGYLLKTTLPEKLIEALREAVDGGAPMSPAIARRIIDLFSRVRPPQRSNYDLTPHELRLLRLLVDGHSYKSAAAALDVTSHTISFHVQKIYEKLQVHSKSEAVSKALREGIVRD